MMEALVSTALALVLISSLLVVPIAMVRQQRADKEKLDHQCKIQKVSNILEKTLCLSDSISPQSDSKLNFTFQNSLDREPAFCGKLGACFELDRGDLLLTVFSREKDLERREQLLEGVRTLQFRYLKMNVEQAEGAWVSLWPPQEEDLPILLQVLVEFEDSRPFLSIKKTFHLSKEPVPVWGVV